jgi:hypothetical protein
VPSHCRSQIIESSFLKGFCFGAIEDWPRGLQVLLDRGRDLGAFYWGCPAVSSPLMAIHLFDGTGVALASG